MDIEKYIATIERISDNCIIESIQVQDYLENCLANKNTELIDLIDVQHQLLTSKDTDLFTGYLGIGYFNNLSKKNRIALFAILFEICDSIQRKSMKNCCDKYTKSQPLFVEIPVLYKNIRFTKERKLDLELIDYKSIEQLNDSEVVKSNGKFAKMDSFLNPAIVAWSKSTFPESPLFIRLDPRFAFNSRPYQKLFESILMPANPNWWKRLTLHNRETTGASYLLEECDLTPDSIHEFLEYKVKGLRRLDISAKRNGDGNLSMMLEELSDRSRATGLVIGKCIHLDSDSSFGTDFNSATINHLDLAINCYFDQAIVARYKGNLADGKVQDATFRTHLLRIENIPLKALLAYVVMFFDSKILINEWFVDQFSNK